MNGMEWEAFTAASTPIYVTRSLVLNGAIFSQSSGVTSDCLIEVDSGALSFAYSGLRHFDRSGAATLTHVIKDNRTGYPAYWGDSTGTGARNEGAASDKLHIGSPHIYVQAQKLQNFVLRITNTGGVLQHRFGGVASPGGALGNYVTKINATDSSTAMAFGGKISSVNTNRFICDTATQDSTYKAPILIASPGAQSVAVPLAVVAQCDVSRNVNGVTSVRLEFQFFNMSTGAAFALTTANIAAGLYIEVQFLGFIA